MTAPGAVLAVDAGNSKTDVALVASDGSLLAATRGGGFHPHRVGAEAAVAGLHELVGEVATQVGLATTEGVADHVAACLANADVPVEVERLDAAVAARGWASSNAVFNDTYALLRAGLDEMHGVAVLCGAGTNCTGVHRDAREVRFAAVGHISGDWGGGGHLWSEAMWWAARAADGRGPVTALREALPAHFGLPDMAALVEAVHLGDVPAERCPEMTPLLFEVAESGDAVAADVVRRQADEVVTFAVAALRRLDAMAEPMEVVLGGGVLTAGHPLLMDAIERSLGERAPYASSRVVAAPLVLGAALLGLDHLGLDGAAAERVRAAYAPDALPR
jgi:N-acetylglucosamine kinase-like BadF-type ATPase